MASGTLDLSQLIKSELTKMSCRLDMRGGEEAVAQLEVVAQRSDQVGADESPKGSEHQEATAAAPVDAGAMARLKAQMARDQQRPSGRHGEELAEYANNRSLGPSGGERKARSAVFGQQIKPIEDEDGEDEDVGDRAQKMLSMIGQHEDTLMMAGYLDPAVFEDPMEIHANALQREYQESMLAVSEQPDASKEMEAMRQEALRENGVWGSERQSVQLEAALEAARSQLAKEREARERVTNEYRNELSRLTDELMGARLETGRLAALEAMRERGESEQANLSEMNNRDRELQVHYSLTIHSLLIHYWGFMSCSLTVHSLSTRLVTFSS